MCCISRHPRVSFRVSLFLTGISARFTRMLRFAMSMCVYCISCPFPIQFVVHAAVSANTFAVYGTGHVKELTELVPGILNQLGPDSLASLRKLAESYQAIQQNQQRPPNAAADEDEDDDDVPDLVENFDAVEDKAADKSKLEELN